MDDGITIFDVGHGNCTLVQSDGARALIDGGGSKDLLPLFESMGITSIDLVVVSHADADHIRGIIALVASTKIRIGRIAINQRGLEDTKAWRILVDVTNQAWLEKSCIVDTGFQTGTPESIAIGATSLEVLGPTPDIKLTGAGNKLGGIEVTTNSGSIVIVVSFEGQRIALLPGDIDQLAIVRMEAAAQDLRARYLVFPHHGGKAGTGDSRGFARRLVQLVEPERVFFSTGWQDPSKGGLHPDILAGIREQDAQVIVACTQLSQRCHDDLTTLSPTHLLNLDTAGIRRGSCCSGTIWIPLDGGPTPAQEGVNTFIDDQIAHPMCRA